MSRSLLSSVSSVAEASAETKLVTTNFPAWSASHFSSKLMRQAGDCNDNSKLKLIIIGYVKSQRILRAKTSGNGNGCLKGKLYKIIVFLKILLSGIT